MPLMPLMPLMIKLKGPAPSPELAQQLLSIQKDLEPKRLLKKLRKFSNPERKETKKMHKMPRIQTAHLRTMELERFASSQTDGSVDLTRLTDSQLGEYKARIEALLDDDNDPVLLSERSFVSGFLAGREDARAT